MVSNSGSKQNRDHSRRSSLIRATINGEEVRRLPIVDREDRLVGIVTLDDLLRFLGGELYNLAEGIKHELEVK